MPHPDMRERSLERLIDIQVPDVHYHSVALHPLTILLQNRLLTLLG